MADAAVVANGCEPSSVPPSRGNSGHEGSAGTEEAGRLTQSAETQSGTAANWPEWPGAARPAGWFLPIAREAAPLGEPGPEPARPEPSGGEATGSTGTAVVGPTAALRGNPGGPGFPVAGDSPAADHARSGWQVAQGVWRGSGIRWDEPAGTVPGPRSSAPPGHAEQAFAAGPPRPGGFPGHQTFFAAPTVTDAPDTGVPDPVIPGTPMATGEASERYTAWRESVREASAPAAAREPEPGPVPVPRRNLARAAMPAAVIAAVGAGAFLMLTGQAGQILNEIPRAHGLGGLPGVHASQASGPAKAAAAGRHGPATVSASASSGGTRLTVGSADGHAAVWFTRTGLSWTKLDLPLPGGADRAALRFTVARAATVVAVGDAQTGHGSVPFVAMSRDGGQKWQQVNLPAPGGTTVTALTASPAGFAATGKAGGHTVRWTSRDGVTWHAATGA